jgi:transcriptional regulator GlxA family with amidase domain
MTTPNNSIFSGMKQNSKMTVGILIFDQVEVLDVAGPFEVFSVTRLNENRRCEEPSPFKVILVSENTDQVTAVGGLIFIPDTTMHKCPDLDLLIIPGGWGTRKQISNKALLRWIVDRAVKARLTASVCTGSSLLGKAGLLDGREATTHWRAFDFLRESAPMVKIRENVRFTTTEPIYTSAGISSGIDLALRIVSHFFGTEVGKATARHMEYPYPQSDQRVVI